MVQAIFTIMDKLDPFPKQKSPQLAGFLGFVLGGLALGVYFLSFIDFLIPIGIAIAATVIAQQFGDLAGLGWLAGAIIAALWGYFRALNSNQRLSGERVVP
jgi:hypothetical protein